MDNHFIDLRSDTVTRPGAAMRAAMMEAEVGDDVFGEDPTVNRLQNRVAELLGKAAALFVPSGTMGNQLCLKVHTQPGDEVIAERGSHVFNYETGAAAFLSHVQLLTIEGHHGQITVEQIRQALRPRLYYMPRSRLICLENTHNRAGGTIYPLELMQAISAFASEEGLRVHLDGARLWNASAATGRAPHEYAACADSVSVCLSKGLGAPVGSLIAGSREFIEEARHYRKIFGGGMRQAGILAAAGLYALDHHLGRLPEDHQKARMLAQVLAEIPGVTLDRESVQTNIIIFGVQRTGRTPEEHLSTLKERGVLLSAGNYMGLRAVTHLDVSFDQVARAGEVLRQSL